jgi:hypothetical protein
VAGADQVSEAEVQEQHRRCGIRVLREWVREVVEAHQNIGTTPLRWRREADAINDEAEKKVEPEDRFLYYLKGLEIATDHLVTVAIGKGTVCKRVTFGGTNVDAFAEACIYRAEVYAPCKEDERWRSLWDSLIAGIKATRGWSADATTAEQVARVIFVSAVILRRAYEGILPSTPTGVERGFEMFATKVPVPIDTALSLPEQMQGVSQNLGWLHENLSKKRSRVYAAHPRWY